MKITPIRDNYTEITGCPNCDKAEWDICFINNQWRFERDDGMSGVIINYCPFCGTKLPDEPLATTEEAAVYLTPT